jgi:hypothetical protein
MEFQPRTPPSSPSSPKWIIPELSVALPSRFWDNENDDYGRRASVALNAIHGTPDREGLIAWLGEHSPFLYRSLTQDLPDEISSAWDTQIRLEDFDWLCSVWVSTYRHAAELYRTDSEARRKRK